MEEIKMRASLISHPVCCGIGIVCGVSEGYDGLGEDLERIERDAFGWMGKACLMLTSNELEEQGFRKVLQKRKWYRVWAGPNPIHGNRLMTIWVKDNPRPKKSAVEFEEWQMVIRKRDREFKFAEMGGRD